MPSALDLFRALADDVRLRIVHAVMAAELSVAELVDVLGLPQSTVSRHLKPLREAGILEARREGTSVYYRRGPLFEDASLERLLQKRLADLPTAEVDLRAVREALDRRRLRSREFFEKVAGRYSELTQPGGGWPALAASLAAGFADRTVADLGCGEGILTLMLARFARKVIAVDLSAAMLRLVRAKADAGGLASKVETVEGDLERTGLSDACCDDVFLSQALHHAARPARAIEEAARILKPGGLLIVLDLVRHEQEWTRTEWADQWLGFDEAEVRGWMDVAGMDVLQTVRMDPSKGGELAVLLAVGRKLKRAEGGLR